MMQRRDFIKIISGTFIGSVAFISCLSMPSLLANAASFGAMIKRSNAEWKIMLTKEQFHILREQGTERAFTSDLLHEKRNGVYHCAGCDLPLFQSDTKFDSGTGWPSFYAPIGADHVVTSTDYKIGVPRTEFHCAKCGGHHGHVFKDGPEPTGLRYCSNGAVLKFKEG